MFSTARVDTFIITPSLLTQESNSTQHFDGFMCWGNWKNMSTSSKCELEEFVFSNCRFPRTRKKLGSFWSSRLRKFEKKQKTTTSPIRWKMSNQNRERRGRWNPRLTHFFGIFGNSTLRNFRSHFSRNKIKSLESCGACELKRRLQNIFRPYHRGCNENEGFKKTRSCVFNHFRN